jgi:hypothetical protein
MADQSGSTRFRELFESALEGYEKKSGVTLANHPLAVQLQSSLSVESITTVLQGQAQAFNEFRGGDRVMKSIRITVSILTRLSAVASLGDSTGLVRWKAFMTCSTLLMVFTVNPACDCYTYWPCYPTCCMYRSLALKVEVVVTRK